MPKMSGYVKTFKIKEGDNNFDEKLLKKYRAILTKIEDLKNIELTALTVYYDRFIKPNIRTNGDKVCAKFCGLTVPEDDIEC